MYQNGKASIIPSAEKFFENKNFRRKHDYVGNGSLIIISFDDAISNESESSSWDECVVILENKVW